MRPYVATTCAYAPLPLIHAAGFVHWRILPLGDPPERAAATLHDNICPNVKRLLDRAANDEVPPLAGLVVMDGCDAMRRLADAWSRVRPDVPVALIDLPTTGDAAGIRWLHSELRRLRDLLEDWAGASISDEALASSVGRYNELAEALGSAADLLARGRYPGGRVALQRLHNRAVTQPPEDTLVELSTLREGPAEAGLPVVLFGNVLADPDAFALIAESGARVVADDLCTGSRQIAHHGDGSLQDLARALLSRPICARTLTPADPDRLARQVIGLARRTGAAGVIAHTVKFCDPYLVRLPGIRRQLSAAGLPLLVLEGDCTLRSLGQHSTRIEAFVEMLS